MTISSRVQQELTAAAPIGSRANNYQRKRPLSESNELIAHQNVETTRKKKGKSRISSATINEENKGKAWTKEEHARFLEGLALYPSGPWKAIAAIVQSKSPRQTMTHAQKYRQKHERRARGLRKRRNKAVDRRSVIQVADAAMETTDDEYNSDANTTSNEELEDNSEVPGSSNNNIKETELNCGVEEYKVDLHENVCYSGRSSPSPVEDFVNQSPRDSSHPSCAIIPESPRSCEALPQLSYKNHILGGYDAIYESLFSRDVYNRSMETVIFELESNPPVALNALEEWWEYNNMSALDVPSFGHTLDEDLKELSQEISWSTYDL